tara:strand:+ start:542 stop:976 length:435 start_codon:yes stop_codon:yes gene_type:complete
MKFYITGTRRGLGKALSEKYNIVDNLNEADVFINCKHDGFSQVDLLYKAAELNKKIINIGSAASDWTKGYKDNFKYGIEKKTLREVNDQLFWQGIDTCIINYGLFDTPRVEHIDKKKMSVDYCISIIDWVLEQKHRVKEITICP